MGFHGCPETIATSVLGGKPFKTSSNDYDWLGEGVYFWENNPHRGLEFAQEKRKREGHKYKVSVVGAVIDVGLCLDLTTSAGVDQTRSAFVAFKQALAAMGAQLPQNTKLLRRLDCAVINYLHHLREERRLEGIQTVRGVFDEGEPAYAGAGFSAKTHIQLAVRDPKCIKGVFKVPKHLMSVS